MPAAPVSESRVAALNTMKLLARFGAVGLSATALYAVLAFILGQGAHFAPVRASLTAYAAAAAYSYVAHKIVTFMSPGQHRSEAPRFLVATAAGFAVAYLAPAVLVGWLGLPPALPIVVTSLLVPVVNFVLLSRWVFADRARR